jgi:hypothetical protein
MLVVESYILFSWLHVIQEAKDIDYVKNWNAPRKWTIAFFIIMSGFVA